MNQPDLYYSRMMSALLLRGGGVAPLLNNFLNSTCGRYGIIADIFLPGFFPQGSAELKHFKPVLTSHHSYGALALARCALTKYTVCRSDNCVVKKTVQCHEVCNLISYSSKSGKFSYKNCQKSLCKGRFGTIACHQLATMA